LLLISRFIPNDFAGNWLSFADGRRVNFDSSYFVLAPSL
jgi:hypothetical protein